MRPSDMYGQELGYCAPLRMREAVIYLTGMERGSHLPDGYGDHPQLCVC